VKIDQSEAIMLKKLGSALGIVAVMLSLILWYVYADFVSRRELKVSHPPSVSVFNAMPLAESVVKERNQDAYLSDIVAIFPPKTISIEDMKVSYFYVGTEFKLWRKRWLSYIVEIDSRKQDLIKLEVSPTIESLTSRSQIEESLLDIDKIIEIAEANGGKEFRKAHPDYKLLVRPGLRWSVEYKDLNSSQYYDLRILIDGRNGVVEESELR